MPFFVLPCKINRLIQHVFDKNSVAAGGVIDQDVGDSAHEFSVLKDRGAAHSEYDASIGDSCLFQ